MAQDLRVLLELENESVIIAENTDEFLAKFSLTQFENRDVISIFRSLISRGPPIAERIGDPSAVGRVYKLGNGPLVPDPLHDKVLKNSPMCPGGNMPPGLLGQLCDMARQGDLIFRFPNTETGKMIVLAPNYILEGLCGIILSRLQQEYTPAFMRLYAFQYDNGPTKSVFTLTESLMPLNQIIGRHAPLRDFAFVAFQIAQGLATAQMASRFTHYDLHEGNVMARPCNQTNIYELGNGHYLYSRRPADAVIIDYGHIRMETQESVLQPNMMFRMGDREVLDWYDFNPYYDLFSFLFTQERKVGRFTNWTPAAGSVEETDQKFLFQSLWGAFFNTPTNDRRFITNLLDHIRGRAGMHWRPIPERLAMEWTDPVTNLTFSRASTPEQFMVKVADIIKGFLPAFGGSPTNPNDVNAYLNANEFYISTQLTNLDTVGSPTTIYKLPRDIMRQKFYNYKIDNEPDEVLHGIEGNIVNISTERWQAAVPVVAGTVRAQVPRCAPGATWEPWNHTGLANNPANQVITVAEIDVERGLREGYEFRLDCCRLDLRAYFQDVDAINSGIGINAAFFSIIRPGASYLPIGEFRNDAFSSNLPIPPDYLDWYGVVAVQDNGKLIIVSPAQAGAYRQILTVGPVLVGFDHTANGGVGAVRNMVGNNIPYGRAGWPRRIELANPRFQCTPRGGAGGFNNCDAIQPGEFSHASNPNPRSALGLKEDGTTVLVTVQGRGADAAGMDLEQLAQFMIAIGCHWAINLDGGRSSRMAWRQPGETMVRVAAAAQQGMGSAEAYPVGNIIAFVK
tara:strand:+ start:349 stop:2727 length:2379 start_codon:yes stop_codon:yes gene_type:complete